MERIEVEAQLQLWRSLTSNTASAYIVIAGDEADALRAAAMTGQWLEGKRSFGSAKVVATVGETSWQTSIFPVKGSDNWFLPIRKVVREAESLAEGEPVRVTIAL